MVLDLNHALLYGNMDGSWREAGQAKNYLTIVDGIVGGEGNGPLCPAPVKSNFQRFILIKILDLIPHVAAILLKRLKGLRPVFYLSLQEDSSGWRRIREKAHRHGSIDSVRTVGKINPAHASSFYSEADAMLLPSVLESFSANYPEAMISGVPIVKTDLPLCKRYLWRGCFIF
jgi:glycosyltransferase involved in cell wall biosynthesis